jgi:hypothetical protein
MMMSIIDRLIDKQVVCIERMPNGDIGFTEACDWFYRTNLKPNEVAELIKELAEMGGISCVINTSDQFAADVVPMKE